MRRTAASTSAWTTASLGLRVTSRVHASDCGRYVLSHRRQGATHHERIDVLETGYRLQQSRSTRHFPSLTHLVTFYRRAAPACHVQLGPAHGDGGVSYQRLLRCIARSLQSGSMFTHRSEIGAAGDDVAASPPVLEAPVRLPFIQPAPVEPPVAGPMEVPFESAAMPPHEYVAVRDHDVPEPHGYEVPVALEPTQRPSTPTCPPIPDDLQPDLAPAAVTVEGEYAVPQSRVLAGVPDDISAPCTPQPVCAVPEPADDPGYSVPQSPTRRLAPPSLWTMS